MEPQLIQFSAVVAGTAHNPTILNPDFLALRNIVPREWAWEVTETITTPPFASVRYANGLAITVEPNKLQVTDPGVTDEDPTKSKAAGIAEAYVKILPHVRYAAAGINFQSIIEMESAERYLKERFLRPGPWDSSTHPITAAGFRLVYSLERGGRLTLSLDAGVVERTDQEDAEQRKVPAVIANANFQRDCQGYPSDEQVVDYLKNVGGDWNTYRSVLSELLSTKE